MSNLAFVRPVDPTEPHTYQVRDDAPPYEMGFLRGEVVESFADLQSALDAADRLNIRSRNERHRVFPLVAQFDPERLTIVRHRFSITQAEVELFYMELRIGRYGDEVKLVRDGANYTWAGLPDRVWVDIARKAVERPAP